MTPQVCARPSNGRSSAAPRISLRLISAFHAEDLFQGVDDVHEIGLVGHHLVDALVRPGDLVEHALVLAADYALGLTLQVFYRKALLRGVAAHPASRSVRAGMEAFCGTLAAHDVAARAHAARDDAELARARADR